MNSLIAAKAEKWTRPPYDAETREEISELITDDNIVELSDRFYRDLDFGTGGLRGKLGAGSNRMNVYTVGLATQGLAGYLLKEGLADKGVVIAYDSRRCSEKFARECAAVLAGNGVKAYLFDRLTSVPLCSFAIRELQAGAGVVITASHNPPEYNGYKVYFSDGCQIVPPQDKQIISEISAIDSIDKIKKTDIASAISRGTVTIIGDKLRQSYIDQVIKALPSVENAQHLSIVYSPLHGSGITILPDLLKSAGFNELSIVKAQMDPDGDFPTVEYPNPEEKQAMALALQDAKAINADIVFATDPDADRIGVGVCHNDEYHLLNGNQTAVLLCDYIINNLKREKILPDNPVVIKTILTTELLKVLCEKESVEVLNVLTGFKWIGALMREFEQSEAYNFIFGCEESYGYLPVNFVRDKDAVSTALLLCEMAAYYKNNGMDLYERLMQIYREFGYYLEEMRYIVLEGADGADRIRKIMENFRSMPPVLIGEAVLISIHDYQEQLRYDCISETADTVQELPVSNVLQYFYSDGSGFTIRPSGTEPKIKFYISAVSVMGDRSFAEVESEARITADRVMDYIETRITEV
ncbi:MAG: phospho-sugar mutase [Spirochaetes bacterium]|jgi:phosphoglucomutase|nr:phospho-sugar mutase [Spirochaetota bacterium]